MEEIISKKEKKDYVVDSSIIEIVNDYLFCNICMMFPEYMINIENRTVLLSHVCLDSKEQIKEFPLKDQNAIKIGKNCEICKIICNNLCLKCNMNLCDNCSKAHDMNIPIDKRIQYEQKLICSILDQQYYCKEHLLQYIFFCPICKINLCRFCKEEHYHINCPSLLEERKNIQIVEKLGEDDLMLKLNKLSYYFYQCYMISFAKNVMTLNIILNLDLANKIKSYVSSSNKKKKKKKKIKNDYLDSLDINYYLCKNGENDFTENFKNLLLNFASGNIKSSHKLKEIQNYYYSKVNLKINSFFLETMYITSLSLLIMDTRNNFYNMQNIVLSNEFKLISMNLLKNLNIVSLKNNILELNLEKIKRITVNNNF